MLRVLLRSFHPTKDFFKIQARRLSTELAQANGSARLKFPSSVPFSVYAGGATLAVGGSVAWLKYDIKESRDILGAQIDRLDTRIDRLDTKVDEVKKEVADLKLDLKQDIAELKVLFFQDKAQKLENKSVSKQRSNNSSNSVDKLDIKFKT